MSGRGFSKILEPMYPPNIPIHTISRNIRRILLKERVILFVDIGCCVLV
jgi:hypothetical protein